MSKAEEQVQYYVLMETTSSEVQGKNLVGHLFSLRKGEADKVKKRIEGLPTYNPKTQSFESLSLLGPMDSPASYEVLQAMLDEFSHDHKPISEDDRPLKEDDSDGPGIPESEILDKDEQTAMT